MVNGYFHNLGWRKSRDLIWGLLIKIKEYASQVHPLSLSGLNQTLNFVLLQDFHFRQRSLEEEQRKAKAVSMGSQGAWTNWPTTSRKLTWKDIWSYQPLRLSFLLRSVYDVLPSPANLHRWGLAEQPQCQLCGGIGTLEHILSSCKTSLTQGRYRWRHDTILKDMAEIIETE